MAQGIGVVRRTRLENKVSMHCSSKSNQIDGYFGIAVCIWCLKPIVRGKIMDFKSSALLAFSFRENNSTTMPVGKTWQYCVMILLVVEINSLSLSEGIPGPLNPSKCLPPSWWFWGLKPLTKQLAQPILDTFRYPRHNWFMGEWTDTHKRMQSKAVL